MNYLLFDIGGTNSRFAMSTDGLTFSEPKIVDTPKDFDEAIELFSGIAQEISGGKIDRAGGGIAGALDSSKTGLYRSPNLPLWENKNFVEAFSNKINSSVHIENDTAIVGLGEAVAGAGRLYNIVVYITISTGVNGAKINEKQIDENVSGFEIGHQIIDFDNSQNIGSSNKGTLEDFVSGREVQKRFGVHPKEIKDEKEWRKIAEWAAIGIYNTVLHWSPEVVVLGGAMMRDIPVDIVREKLHSMLAEVYPDSPEVVKAELGSIGGLHGALHYLRSI